MTDNSTDTTRPPMGRTNMLDHDRIVSVTPAQPDWWALWMVRFPLGRLVRNWRQVAAWGVTAGGEVIAMVADSEGTGRLVSARDGASGAAGGIKIVHGEPE